MIKDKNLINIKIKFIISEHRIKIIVILSLSLSLFVVHNLGLSFSFYILIRGFLSFLFELLTFTISRFLCNFLHETTNECMGNDKEGEEEKTGWVPNPGSDELESSRNSLSALTQPLSPDFQHTTEEARSSANHIANVAIPTMAAAAGSVMQGSSPQTAVMLTALAATASESLYQANRATSPSRINQNTQTTENNQKESSDQSTQTENE